MAAGGLKEDPSPVTTPIKDASDNTKVCISGKPVDATFTEAAAADTKLCFLYPKPTQTDPSSPEVETYQLAYFSYLTYMQNPHNDNHLRELQHH